MKPKTLITALASAIYTSGWWYMFTGTIEELRVIIFYLWVVCTLLFFIDLFFRFIEWCRENWNN
jgi:hypothetical protein